MTTRCGPILPYGRMPFYHRPIERRGAIMAGEILGGLHHQYRGIVFFEGTTLSNQTLYDFGVTTRDNAQY
jgi:hypothetical protein